MYSRAIDQPLYCRTKDNLCVVCDDDCVRNDPGNPRYMDNQCTAAVLDRTDRIALDLGGTQLARLPAPETEPKCACE